MHAVRDSPSTDPNEHMDTGGDTKPQVGSLLGQPNQNKVYSAPFFLSERSQ